MALLIDGYNLLNVSDVVAAAGAGTELQRARLALLEFLSATIEQRERGRTTIVFDAAGAPPGLPSLLKHDGMTVQFSRRQSSADELIEELLESWKSPKSLTVVSSDHRVQRAARRRGAAYVDSETWFAELRAKQRERAAAGGEVRSKPDAPASPEEVSYWLKEFSVDRGEPKKPRRNEG